MTNHPNRSRQAKALALTDSQIATMRNRAADALATARARGSSGNHAHALHHRYMETLRLRDAASKAK